MNPEWLPIESAPRDGTFILAILQGESEPGVPYIPCVVSYNGSWEMADLCESCQGTYEPTHFMPLPEPPKP